MVIPVCCMGLHSAVGNIQFPLAACMVQLQRAACAVLLPRAACAVQGPRAACAVQWPQAACASTPMEAQIMNSCVAQRALSALHFKLSSNLLICGPRSLHTTSIAHIFSWSCLAARHVEALHFAVHCHARFWVDFC